MVNQCRHRCGCTSDMECDHECGCSLDFDCEHTPPCDSAEDCEERDDGARGVAWRRRAR